MACAWPERQPPAATYWSLPPCVARFASLTTHVPSDSQVKRSSEDMSGGASAAPPRKKPGVLRLMQDLRGIQDEAPAGISAAPLSEDNMFVWNASIIGPDESPWEGGIYALRLTFPPEYPDKPPAVRFMSEMWHPNVYSDGSLCLDIIQDSWSPIYTVSTILSSIQSLLTDPNPASPANPEAAKMYNTDLKSYKRRVRRCAERSLESTSAS